ncbi:MAG TPA: hypothetical protein VEA37_11295 [Flavobacterium sp.]|nr:hypothetical protein [Flavobacterium sp.]
MLFNEESYGKPISEKLSQYLIDWTSEADVAKVSVDMPKENKVSVSTINSVKRRLGNLTENNAAAIISLMGIAVKNCTNKIEYAKRVKKELEKYSA